MYTVQRNTNYDYTGQSYQDCYPNLHKYPATMLPQLGIDILKELHISSGNLLDPYCGSGSSFSSALACGIKEMYGYDLNPLAILLCNVKFTSISYKKWQTERTALRERLYSLLKNEKKVLALKIPDITNRDFWFSPHVSLHLTAVKHCIDTITDKPIQKFFLLVFSETVRDCSYTRHNEFKLFRMKPEDILYFNPDVISVFFHKLDKAATIYFTHYAPKLSGKTQITLEHGSFQPKPDFYDTVLTSPPYGDSRTTVAYGQFSALSNEWLGIREARKIDSMLMGGHKATECFSHGLIADYIERIGCIDPKRALEISAFYQDLATSISQVARSVVRGGKAIYIVGNRTVKGITLPTDQFIAEQFHRNGFSHIITYQRALSNKSMPCKNSPTNQKGKVSSTMLCEYIVICEKK